MDICINPQIHKNPWITRTNMNMIRISYLSNGADTYITLSASMKIHLHL